jgi:exopolysaccharide production protein ExoQ
MLPPIAHPESLSPLVPLGQSPVPLGRSPTSGDRLAGKDLLRLIEVLLLLLGFTFMSGAFGVGPEAHPSSTVRSMLFPRVVQTLIAYTVWGGSIGFILISWRQALQRIAQTGLLWVLVALILSSSLWSINPAFVNLMNREFWQMTCFALFVVLRFSFVQQLRGITLCLGAGAIVSGLLALGVPSIGRHTIDHVGAWKGLYDYKNTLGSMMIVGLISFYLTSARSAGEKLYRAIGFGICAAIILLSTSKSALLLGVFALLVVVFYQKYRWRGELSIVLTSLMLPLLTWCGFMVVNNWVPLVTGLGKDPTISGRTGIWLAALHHIQERPWLGFGRSAFWAPGSLYAIRAGERVSSLYVPPHAHNGFLDLLLDVGYIGLAVFAIIFVWVYGQSLWLAYNAQRPEDYWPVGYLSFLAMNNMTESFLVRLANPFWVLFLIAALNLPELIKARRRGSPTDLRSTVRDGP